MNKNKLTAKTKNLSEEFGLPFNTVMTHFFLEVVLSKLAYSDVGKYFILKGGILLSNIVGVSERSTVDIDFLLNNNPLNEKSILKLMESAFKSSVYENIICNVKDIKDIRTEDIYGGFQLKLECTFENIKQIVQLDIATGDPITPKPQLYNYKRIYDDEIIPLKSYNLETIVSEKLETIYSRGLLNSRSKDFYDMYIILKTKEEELSLELLKEAIGNTFEYRKTEWNIEYFKELLNNIENDEIMNKRWKKYQSREPYTKDILFKDIFVECNILLNKLRCLE